MANGEARNRVKGASGRPWANIPGGSAGSQLFRPGSGRLRWYSVRSDAGDRKRTTRPRNLCASPLPGFIREGTAWDAYGRPSGRLRSARRTCTPPRPGGGWPAEEHQERIRRGVRPQMPILRLPGGQRAARGCCRRPLVRRRLWRRALHRLLFHFVNLTARGTLVVPVLDPRDGRLRRTVRVIVGLYWRDEALFFAIGLGFRKSCRVPKEPLAPRQFQLVAVAVRDAVVAGLREVEDGHQ